MAKDDDNKINTTKVPSSVVSKMNKTDDDINFKMFGLSKDDEKDVPKTEDSSVNKLNKLISDIGGNSTDPNDNILDLFASLNSKTGILSNNRTLNKKRGDKNSDYNNLIKQIQDSFNADSVDSEKDRISLYDDYDTIDSCIPELSQALDVYTDSILSPDDTTKKSFMYYYGKNIDDKTISNDNSSSNSQFEQSMRKLLDNHNIEEDLPARIRDAIKYGDLFLMILDMNKSANQMLNENKGPLLTDQTDDDGEVLTEGMMIDDSNNQLLENLFNNFKDRKKVYDEFKKSYKNLKSEDSLKKNIIDDTRKDIINRVNKNVKFSNNPMDMLSDYGDLSKNSEDFKRNYQDYNFSGAYIKNLDPRNVFKIESDNVVLGYFVIEAIGNSYENMENGGTGTLSSLGSSNSQSASMLSVIGSEMGAVSGMNNNSASTNSTESSVKSQIGMNSPEYHDTALEYKIITDLFIKGIGKKISKDFINKNKDVEQVIYSLLRKDYILKKSVRVTFLNPDEVVHLKIDSTSTYGTSRLSKSLFFAKLYLATLLTTVMTKVTNGKDKRAYYVDTGLDGDIEDTIQGMIADVKSKEFSSSNFSGDKSVSTMLNNVGAGDDYFIPTINGSSPLNIESIPGEQTDINDEFLNYLKRSTISGAGIPQNYIDATQEADYARSLSMQNNGFVRKIIRYQGAMSKFWTKVIRRVYELDFPEQVIDSKKGNSDSKIDITQINVSFPTPIFMTLSNNNEQISNVSATVDFLSSVYFQDSNQDPKYLDAKSKFRKSVTEHYMQTLDWSLFDKLVNEAKQDSNYDSIEKSATKTDDTVSTEKDNGDNPSDFL